jgi:hypothetical protein
MWNLERKIIEVKTKVTYDHTNISNSTDTKFWGLITDKTVVESTRSDSNQTVLCLLCSKKSKTYCTLVYTMNNILRLYTFHFKL